MVFGWLESSAAEPAPPPPTPWWEKEEEDAASASLKPDVDVGARLLKTAEDFLFDEKLFERLLNHAHLKCEEAAAVGGFGTKFSFLRFKEGTPWYLANNTGRVYRKRLADVLEPAGITVSVTMLEGGDDEPLEHVSCTSYQRVIDTLKIRLSWAGEYGKKQE